LKELQLDYLDLYLIHWPLAWEFTGYQLKPTAPKDEQGRPKFSKTPLIDTWREMENLVDAGLIKSIGVSNFNNQTLVDIYQGSRIQPAVNQIEVNPLNTRPELIEVCKMLNVHVTAYSAFGTLPTASLMAR
jgi:aldehyde reductase